jgi:hypothetical protein
MKQSEARLQRWQHARAVTSRPTGGNGLPAGRRVEAACRDQRALVHLPRAEASVVADLLECAEASKAPAGCSWSARQGTRPGAYRGARAPATPPPTSRKGLMESVTAPSASTLPSTRGSTTCTYARSSLARAGGGGRQFTDTFRFRGMQGSAGPHSRRAVQLVSVQASACSCRAGSQSPPPPPRPRRPAPPPRHPPPHTHTHTHTHTSLPLPGHPLVQLLQQVGVEGVGVALLGVQEGVAKGAEAQADAVGAHLCNHRPHHLQAEADAVLDAAACGGGGGGVSKVCDFARGGTACCATPS